MVPSRAFQDRIGKKVRASRELQSVASDRKINVDRDAVMQAARDIRAAHSSLRGNQIDFSSLKNKCRSSHTYPRAAQTLHSDQISFFFTTTSIF
mmetsp:Transcript_29124/g.40523  ORF Transcript_29124/g.40523 Transcript_29124/m.40523 type:complete len:94 (+) Transcript_29124:2-283(+)